LPCCISFVGLLLVGSLLDWSVPLDGPLPHLSGNSLPLNFDIDLLPKYVICALVLFWDRLPSFTVLGAMLCTTPIDHMNTQASVQVNLKELLKAIVANSPNVTLLRDMKGPVDVFNIDGKDTVAEACSAMAHIESLTQSFADRLKGYRYVSLYQVQKLVGSPHHILVRAFYY
jgi:hypothetical protein